MRLLIQPADRAAPLLAAIKSAKKSIEIAIFRFDRLDVELALRAAAEKGVRVTALIAFANRGGEKSLRKLESRLLEAGIIVARTADDLVKYHGKYLIIDRRVLHLLSFNLTRLDIEHSRAFGIVTTRSLAVKEAVRLFRADCTRTKYTPKVETFVVSPANSRRVLGAFLKRATKQLLIYDPKISDKEMLKILEDRSKAGVEIRVVGQVTGRVSYDVKKLQRLRLHTRSIIRDGRHAFVGSQSLRTAELDSRREVGLIVQDAKAVKKLMDTFEADWVGTTATRAAATADVPAGKAATSAALTKEVTKAVGVFTRELAPLANTVKKAVRHAVNKAGEDVLRDKDVKDTMKKVVKQAVKEAVKSAVSEAKASLPPRDAT